MVLCYLEGLSQQQAARRLRCPVGTVESRLHRARERLRSGLARRGLAPAVGALVGVLERTSWAAVPSNLAKATAAAAARISAGEALAGTVPAAVAGMAGFILRRMIMRQYWMIAGLITVGLATTGGAVGLATARPRDEPKATPRADDPKPAAKAVVRPKPSVPSPRWPRSSIASRPSTRAPTGRLGAFYRGSTIPEENQAKAAEIQPDYPAVVRRIFDLAATAPKDPAVRDAMLWMIQKAQGGSETVRMPASSPWRRAGSSGTSATTPTRCGWVSSSTTGRPPTATTCC